MAPVNGSNRFTPAPRGIDAYGDDVSAIAILTGIMPSEASANFVTPCDKPAKRNSPRALGSAAAGDARHGQMNWQRHGRKQRREQRYNEQTKYLRGLL